MSTGYERHFTTRKTYSGDDRHSSSKYSTLPLNFQKDTKRPSSYYNSLSNALNRQPQATDGNRVHLVGVGVQILDQLSTKIALRAKTVYLSNNDIDSLRGISQFTNLKSLSCSNNKISSIDELRYLSDLINLEKLSIDGNPVCGIPYFREYIIALCPNLTHLDSSKGNKPTYEIRFFFFLLVTLILSHSL